jgi:hypothetical protein
MQVERTRLYWLRVVADLLDVQASDQAAERVQA